MRAEHRRPFVAFFLVAALCALALGNTTGSDPVPEPFARTPDRLVVPRAAPAPVGFELLGETAAQLLVKRIRAAAAVDAPAGPAAPGGRSTALAGVDAGAADSVAPEPARVRSAQTRLSGSTRAGVRRPSPQPAAKPAPLTVARSPQPAAQPAPHSSGGTERSSTSSTSGRPAHAGSGRTSHRTTTHAKSHDKSQAKGHGQARGKSSGKARAKGHGRGRGRR